MHSDAFFTIGTSHTICQDYALAGKTKDGKAFAVVADGCSSSAHTDFGARLIAAAAIDCAEYRSLLPAIVYSVAKDSLPKALSATALDATLLVALETTAGVVVDRYGDGFVIARRRDGVIEVVSDDFNNAPPYLSYLLDANRMREYLKYTGGICKTSIVEMGAKTNEELHGMQHENVLCTVNPTIVEFCTWAYHSSVYTSALYDLVVLVSDGLGSFVRKDGNAAPTAHELIADLLGIKTFTGEFVTRRAKRFLQTAKNAGLEHYDDLGLAAIYLGDLPK